jgi:hypothetical protein
MGDRQQRQQDEHHSASISSFRTARNSLASADGGGYPRSMPSAALCYLHPDDL